MKSKTFSWANLIIGLALTGFGIIAPFFALKDSNIVGGADLPIYMFTFNKGFLPITLVGMALIIIAIVGFIRIRKN